MKRILRVNDLKGYWWTPSGYVRAVDGISFDVYENDIVGVVGESGCGKSTLAKLITGVIEPPLRFIGGEVIIGDVNLYDLPSEERRRKISGGFISLVPQSAMNALNPTKRIIDLIVDVMNEHYPKKYSKDEIVEIARERFKEVDLDPSTLNLYPFELSGGMKQRSVIAISTMPNPKILITDEPTSALDVSTQRSILELLWRLREEMGMTIIFITHDIATVRQISDRIIVMYAGKVVEIGETEEVIHNPLHPYTKGLMASIITPEPEVRKREIEGIPGSPPDLRDPPSGCRFFLRCPFAMKACEKEPLLVNVSGGRLVACWMMKST